MHAQRQWPLILALLGVMLSPTDVFSRALRSAMPLSAMARERCDPLLILASGEARDLIPLGFRSAARYPVLIRSRLSDVELQRLGARPHTRTGAIVTAHIAREDLEALASHPDVLAIELTRRLTPNLDVSVPEISADAANQLAALGERFTGRGVICGFLDSGIDHTHEDFRDAFGNTRVLAIWDHWISGQPPAGYNYGHEFTRAAIDAGLANQHVNDDGHGTHVVGIACGDGSSLGSAKYRAIAWEADILMVRNGGPDIFYYGGGIPPYDVPGAETVGSVDGLNYMLEFARGLGRPLVVNQSQGVMMGPHDGSSLFEQAYDHLIAEEGLILCLAAGNDQDSDWHGRMTAAGSGDCTLLHDPAGEAQTSIIFECWNEAGDRFRWEVRSPSGEVIAIPDDMRTVPQLIGATTTHSGYPSEPDSVWYWTTTSHPANGQGYFYCGIQNRRRGVGTGEWTVRAIPTLLSAGGTVDLYCERNQHAVRVTEGLSTMSIVGLPGTVTDAITVGAYNTKLTWRGADGGQYQIPGGTEQLGGISGFSSQGPRRDGALKPDIAAPGQMIVSAWAEGYTPSDGEALIDPERKHTLFQGTSMAAPHVAGAVALMLERDPLLTSAQIKTILQQTARADAFTGAVPNPIFGYGKLDVSAALAAVGDELPCATVAGDGNGDGTVDVLDIIASVNHMLALTPLSEEGLPCADLDESGRISIHDLTLIVEEILGAGVYPALSLSLQPVSWRAETVGEILYLTFDSEALGALALDFTVPRGSDAPMIAPEIEHGSPGAVLAWTKVDGQLRLIAYRLAGTLAEGGLTISVPAEGATLTKIELSDPHGRALVPVEERSRVLLALGANPSSDAARITYTVPTSGPVTVDVYDATGRLVDSLWNGWQMAGAHTLSWNTGSVRAGSYFVRLQAGGARRTARVTVTP